MQLGTRWTLGSTPPPRLPDGLLEAISSVEAEVAHLDTAAWRWTLTYLEGQPVAELDDGTVIRLRPATATADAIWAITAPTDQP